MKFLDKLGLAVFSIIVLILSILLCLMLFGFVDIITIALNSLLGVQNGIYITVGILVVLILLSIKCLFFPSWERHSKGADDEGILLQNDNGKLLITKGTIKNLVNVTVEEFKDVEAAYVEVEIDENNEVSTNLTINVRKETIIKEVSTKLQNKIKESVKKATDLDIKEINIKVNDVEREEKKEEEKAHTEEKENVKKKNTAEE